MPHRFGDEGPVPPTTHPRRGGAVSTSRSGPPGVESGHGKNLTHKTATAGIRPPAASPPRKEFVLSTTNVVRPPLGGQERGGVSAAQGPRSAKIVREALAPFVLCHVEPAEPPRQAVRQGWCGWCGYGYLVRDRVVDAGPGLGLTHPSCAREATRVARGGAS